MKKLFGMIITFIGGKRISAPSVLLNKREFREKMDQAVRESNLDQQNIIKEYKKKFQ